MDRENRNSLRLTPANSRSDTSTNNQFEDLPLDYWQDEVDQGEDDTRQYDYRDRWNNLKKENAESRDVLERDRKWTWSKRRNNKRRPASHSRRPLPPSAADSRHHEDEEEQPGVGAGAATSSFKLDRLQNHQLRKQQKKNEQFLNVRRDEKKNDETNTKNSSFTNPDPMEEKRDIDTETKEQLLPDKKQSLDVETSEHQVSKIETSKQETDQMEKENTKKLWTSTVTVDRGGEDILGGGTGVWGENVRAEILKGWEETGNWDETQFFQPLKDKEIPNKPFHQIHAKKMLTEKRLLRPSGVDKSESQTTLQPTAKSSTTQLPTTQTYRISTTSVPKRDVYTGFQPSQTVRSFNVRNRPVVRKETIKFQQPQVLRPLNPSQLYLHSNKESDYDRKMIISRSSPLFKPSARASTSMDKPLKTLQELTFKMF